MKKQFFVSIFCLFVFFLGSTMVFAIVPSGLNITSENNDTSFIISSSNPLIYSAQGGTIEMYYFFNHIQSIVWQAYYGSITKQSVLADSLTSNVLFDWGIQGTPSGWIYFSNSSGVNWSSLRAGNSSDKTDEDASLGLTILDENIKWLFTSKVHNQITNFDGLNNNISANTAWGKKTNSLGTGAFWPTILLRGGVLSSSPAIYAIEIKPDVANYAGVLVDYQIIVPVNKITGSRTYYLYGGIQ